MAHALLAPSSAHRWMHCPGSVHLERTIPEIVSEFAVEGTAAHRLAEICLRDGSDAGRHVGKMYSVGEPGVVGSVDAWLIEKEMAEYVQVYLDYVREVAGGGRLLVEQRLPLTWLTREDGAHGTADAVIVGNEELVIIDLKYGAGVRVVADGNEQLLVYAAAAREHYSIFGNFEKITVVVVQPRLDHIDSLTVTGPELDAFAVAVETAAAAVMAAGQDRRALVPGDKQCRFCKAKAVCPAVTAMSLAKATESFADLEAAAAVDLARSMAAVDMVEGWCRAVRAEVERRLLGGSAVEGYKLVEGRKGSRKWTSEAEAGVEMGLMGLGDDIWKKTLISPTQAEKLFKNDPSVWPALLAMVTQNQGPPSVAPASDKRPAVASVVNGFDDLESLV